MSVNSRALLGKCIRGKICHDTLKKFEPVDLVHFVGDKALKDA